MKLFPRFLLLVLLLALVIPFIRRDKEGLPLMPADKIKVPEIGLPSAPDIKGLLDKVKSGAPRKAETSSDKSTVVYKWKKADGTWHFSDTPNPAGPSEVIHINPDVNVVHIDNPQMPDPEEEVKPDEPQKIDIPFLSPTSIPVEQIPELFKQARQAEQLMDERNQLQQELSQGGGR